MKSFIYGEYNTVMLATFKMTNYNVIY